MKRNFSWEMSETKKDETTPSCSPLHPLPSSGGFTVVSQPTTAVAFAASPLTQTPLSPSTGAALSVGSAVLRGSLINIMGGLIFGMVVALSPLFVHYKHLVMDCNLYSSLDNGRELCHALSHCIWDTAAEQSINFCAFRNSCHDLSVDECTAAVNSNNATYRCEIRQGKDDVIECSNLVGWTPSEVGLVTSSLIVGALIGAYLGSKSIKMTRKRDCILCAISVAIGTVLSMSCWAVGDYSCSLFYFLMARIIVGIGFGGLCVVCPLYSSELVPKDVAAAVGAVFQVTITLGVLIIARLGYVLEYDIRAVQLLMSLSFIVALQMILVVLIQPNLGPKHHSTSLLHFGEDKLHVAPQQISFLQFLSEYPRASITAVCLAGAQQLTGINAIMNYAPQITKAAGFAPMYGNFLVMTLNFVASTIAIPMASAFSARTVFFWAVVGVSLSCFITAIGVSPFYVSAESRATWSVMGLSLFISVFELGIGPFFFVLATEIFAPSVSDQGCSLTNLFNFIFNIVVNFFFPVLVSIFAGGRKDENSKNHGMSTVFFLMGGIGIVFAIALKKLML